MSEKKFVYQSVDLVRVIDGDTVELCIDMGNSIRWQGHFRLQGIDTPEIHGTTAEAGQAARVALMDYLTTNGIDYVETHKPDKYGRWLVTIIAGGANVSGVMISRGLAKPYFGGRK